VFSHKNQSETYFQKVILGLLHIQTF